MRPERKTAPESVSGARFAEMSAIIVAASKVLISYERHTVERITNSQNSCINRNVSLGHGFCSDWRNLPADEDRILQIERFCNSYKVICEQTRRVPAFHIRLSTPAMAARIVSDLKDSTVRELTVDGLSS